MKKLIILVCLLLLAGSAWAVSLIGSGIGGENTITYRSKASASNNGTSVSIPMPSGTVEGDLMVVFLTADYGGAEWSLTGWTTIQDITCTGNQVSSRWCN